MAKYTPGPWFAKYNGHYWDIGTDEDKFGPKIGDVCGSLHSFGSPEAAANACLVAAAPELLGALVDLMNSVELADPGVYDLTMQRAAIVKATGDA